MALQAIHQGDEPSCVMRNGICVVHGLEAHDIVDQTTELVELRARVVELEAQLAAATNQGRTAPVVALRPATTASELTAAEASNPPVEQPQEAADADSFAAAWTEEDASFERRFAARAFFQESSVDERSRRWFLGK